MKKKTTEQIIKEFRIIHGEKYIYDNVEYNGANVKVCITCPVHGDFWQTPSNHLHKSSPQGCPKCAASKM